MSSLPSVEPGFRLASARLSRLRRAAALAGLAIILLICLSGTVHAQPFGPTFLFLNGPTLGYVEVPDSPSLNPTSAFTFEAWVNITDTGGCRSIAGKNYQQAWWIGVCSGPTLRSYLKGSGSLRDAGTIPSGQWTHIAVTFDGANRFHYINGELVGTFAETGPLTTSTAPVQIGSDPVYPHTPLGSIDDVRLWSIARSQSEVREDLKIPVSGTPSGLEAYWPFDNSFSDPIGGHDGTSHGETHFGFLGTGSSCASAASATALCILDRFLVTSSFRVGAPGTAESAAQVVGCPNAGSGLFWFFSPDTWEVMVKAINGCGLNNAYWIFSAATTNVFYRLEVNDYPRGAQRIYFNYPGPPAPAVTDTSAFATCP